MTQDIASHIYGPIFRRKKPEGRDYLLHYEYNKVMLLEGGKGNAILTLGELREEWGFPRQAQYFFSIDNKAYYCMTDTAMPEFGGFYMEPLTAPRNFELLHQAFAGITSSQSYRWIQNRRSCDCCGLKTEPSARERTLVYPSYGQTEYPKISPTVIAAITDGGKLLMSCYAGGVYRNYALIAGSVEIGKTPGDCVRRGATEEAGLRTKGIRYYKNQPWTFSDMEMMGFTAELDGNDTICLEGEELCKAGWFIRDETMEYGPCISAGHEIMKTFRGGEVRRAVT